VSGWRRALEPWKYVINLIAPMENAVSGTENTQRSFPAPPTPCHNRNIPTFAAPYHTPARLAPFPLIPRSPRPMCVTLHRPNRRGEQTAIPGVTLSEI
jgi:hypothetical protein